MDEIIEAATRLCHGEYGSLHLLEGNELPALSHSGSSHHWDYDQEHAHLLDRTTMVGRAAVTREVVHIRDIDADPEYAYSGPRTFRVGLGVPILFEDDLIGAMGIIRRSPEPFADEHIELVKTFADQAAIAITNARLVDALQHQLEQQRAIGDVLRAIARSEGLQTVLDEIVETVSILGRGDNVRMWLVRDGFLHAVANGGWTDGWDYDRAHPHAIDASSASGRAALTKEPVHIPDVTADPEYTYDGPVTFRTNLSVPILLDDEVIGVFGIVHREAQPFSQEVIDLVEDVCRPGGDCDRERAADRRDRAATRRTAVPSATRYVLSQKGAGSSLSSTRSSMRRRGCATASMLSCTSSKGTCCASSRRPPTCTKRTTTHENIPSCSIDPQLIGRVALSREAEQITDVLEDPDYTHEGQEIIGFRALLGVPIAREGELIGAIAVARNVPGPFADDLVELVKTFADEAAVAITDARLIAAIETQLGQQRAVGDILAAVARSEGLEQVFDVVADAATRLCHGDYGAVYLKEGDVLAVVAQRYRQPDVHAYEKENPHPIDRHTAIGRAAVTGEVVHIPDTQLDPEYSWGASKIMEYRGLLAAPILLDGELIGALNVVRVEPEPFADEHIQLMKTFADQAAIAIANARLIDSVRRQLEQQRAISDVLGAVARAEGLDSVLHALVDAACRLCAAQFGEVYLVEGDVLRLAVGHGGPAELYEYEREHPEPVAGDRRSVNGRVLLTQDVVHIPDILEDEEYSWSAANEAGVRALLGAPLLVEGHLAGVFNIVRTAPEPFSDERDRAPADVRGPGCNRGCQRAPDGGGRAAARGALALRFAAGRRARLLGRRGEDARGPSRLRHLDVLRPPRLHELHRAGRAGGAVRGAGGVPRRARRADPRSTRGRSSTSPATGSWSSSTTRSRVENTSSRPCSSRWPHSSGSRSSAATWRKRGHELGLGDRHRGGIRDPRPDRLRRTLRLRRARHRHESRLAPVHAAAPGQTLISQRVLAAVEESSGRGRGRRARAEGLRPADAGLRGSPAEAVSGDAPEAELHGRFTAWVADHAQRIRGDLGPRIRPSPLSRSANRGVEDRGGRALALGSLADLPAGDRAKARGRSRSRDNADRVIGEFRGVAAEVARLLDEKRSVALVAGHSDNLFDVAYCLAGLQISFGTTRYISRTGIIVNKLMTREAFRGTPMVGHARSSSATSTGSSRTRRARACGAFRKRASRIVNLGALEALRTDLARGVLVGIIPTGTSARQEIVDGALRLTMPPISAGTARLLEAVRRVPARGDVGRRAERGAALLRRERRNRCGRVVDGGARGRLRRLPRAVARRSAGGRDGRSATPCRLAPPAPEPEAVLRARPQAGDVRAVEEDDPDGRDGRVRDHRPGFVERDRDDRRARGRRGWTPRTRSGTPGRARSRRRRRSRRLLGLRRAAIRRRSRPSSRRAGSRGRVGANGPAIAATPASTPARCPCVDRREQRRDEALEHVEDDDRQPEALAVRPPHVRGSDVPAPDAADVHAFEDATRASSRTAGSRPDSRRTRTGLFPLASPKG